jgi:hypothetical protein
MRREPWDELFAIAIPAAILAALLLIRWYSS